MLLRRILLSCYFVTEHTLLSSRDNVTFVKVIVIMLLCSSIIRAISETRWWHVKSHHYHQYLYWIATKQLWGRWWGLRFSMLNVISRSHLQEDISDEKFKDLSLIVKWQLHRGVVTRILLTALCVCSPARSLLRGVLGWCKKATFGELRYPWSRSIGTVKQSYREKCYNFKYMGTSVNEGAPIGRFEALSPKAESHVLLSHTSNTFTPWPSWECYECVSLLSC